MRKYPPRRDTCDIGARWFALDLTLVDAPDTKQNMRRAILFELVPLESFLTARDEKSPELPFGRDQILERESLDELRRKAVADSAEYRTPGSAGRSAG